MKLVVFYWIFLIHNWILYDHMDLIFFVYRFFAPSIWVGISQLFSSFSLCSWRPRHLGELVCNNGVSFMVIDGHVSVWSVNEIYWNLVILTSIPQSVNKFWITYKRFCKRCNSKGFHVYIKIGICICASKYIVICWNISCVSNCKIQKRF